MCVRPTTCLCGFVVLCCGGEAEGESVWEWIDDVERWPDSSGLCASEGILTLTLGWVLQLGVRLLHRQGFLLFVALMPNEKLGYVFGIDGPRLTKRWRPRIWRMSNQRGLIGNCGTTNIIHYFSSLNLQQVDIWT